MNRDVQTTIIDQANINSLYTLLEGDVRDSSPFTLTKQQLALLNNEHALHLAGITQSYSLEEAMKIIRGN